MSYTIPDIITWAQISQPLAAIGEAKKKALNRGSFDTDLHTKLYVERKSLEWEYAQDPASDNLFQIGNWVWALSGIYGLQAQFEDTGSGATITPLSPSSTGGVISPVYVVSSDFVDATNWQGQNAEGQTLLATDILKVFWDDAQIFLEEDTQWTRTATGVNILEAGFDATANDYTFYIFISRV